jgi:virulence-associated protein VagC
MPILAKLFTRGKHQFIRWPAEFPLNTKEVEIERKGDAFIIRPRRESQQNMGDWLRHFYATTSALPASFLIDRGDSPPQNRN